MVVSLGFTIGFVWLGSRLLRGARTGTGLPEEGVVAAWAATLFLGVTCWIPLGWDRYYVPLLLVACVVGSIGLSRLPAIARQLHAASKSGVAAAERGRSAIATTATLVAWWLLAFAAWPLPPALVDPSQFFDALDREQVYRDAARAHPDSTLFRRHLGLVHLAHGRPREAALEFEAALRNAQLEPRPNRLRLIARCQISENLVRARLAAGDSARAAEALRIHLASLSRLRQGLRSRDERVVSEFERLIRERTQLLSQLTRR